MRNRLRGRRATERETPAAKADDRIAWFDYAKGICILLVAMMHSTLGVEEAIGHEGFMHWVVAFAKPFRMPDFFLLSGLFLFRLIDRDWRTYLDRKLLHFAYFYVLWLTILMAVKQGPLLVSDPASWLAAFAEAFVTPNPNLWFIYNLPLFFLVTKAAHALRIPNWLLWLGAAALQTFPPHTGWEALDDYGAHYYVFFLSGYLLAPKVFQIAAWARENVDKALLGLAGWFLFNSFIAFTPASFAGFEKIAQIPVLRIGFGLIGAIAVVTIASLLSRVDGAKVVRYAGRNSIVIYVSFVLPMAATRVALLKSGLVTDAGVISLIVWLVAASVPLAFHALIRNTWGRYLFERPDALKIEKPRSKAAVVPEIAERSPRLEGRTFAVPMTVSRR
jgi:uncharacterized membrane protein YcfT